MRCYALLILGKTINKNWVRQCSSRLDGLCCRDCKDRCTRGCSLQNKDWSCRYLWNNREEAERVKMLLLLGIKDGFNRRLSEE
jgi:hypothetical protein